MARNLATKSKPSLRAVLILPFLAQLCAAVGLVGYLSYRTGQQAVQDLVSQLQSETTARVEQQLNKYLEKPHQINRINASDLILGHLSLEDREQLEKYFWQQMQLFPEVSYIYVGTAAGELSGAEPVSGSPPHVAHWSSQSPTGAYETYRTNAQGDRVALQSVVEGYQLKARPWYQAAEKLGRPTWGKPYVSVAPYGTVALPAVYPVYDDDRQLQAVFAVDMALVSIRDFLASLEIGKTGEVFIMERNGLIISSSTDEMPFREVPGGEAKRLRADASDNDLIRETARFLDSKLAGLAEIEQATQLSFKRDGERQRLQVTPYRDRWGLDWLIVVTVPESDFMGQIQANTRTTVWLCVGSLGLAIAAGLATVRWVSLPIRRLNAAAQSLAKGQLDQNVAADQAGTSEVEGLAQSFQYMATQLRESFSTLEQRVEERTAELQDRNQQLAQTLAELQALQDELVRSEKMAVLGQLVAGIAHEINTPLGAIKASIGNVTAALETSLRELPSLIDALAPEERQQFFSLLSNQLSGGVELSFREERQLKRQFCKQLEAKGIGAADLLATSLARLGFCGDLEPLLPLLRSPHSRQILEVANSLAAQTSNTRNIELAIDRAAKIIFALKSYSRREQSGEKVLAQITDEINVVLTIYSHQLKQGIEVIKEFESVGAIACYAEELNQVWTNLIHNSIQAMSHQGTLKISVREVRALPAGAPEGSEASPHLCVQVTDSGCGIPAEIQDQIFEPFFTTKIAGEGTGLGLDIVRRIVTKHQGQIAVKSVPGQTVFTVLIPTQTAPETVAPEASPAADSPCCV